MIAVIDYGMGNLFNICNGLSKVGAQPNVISVPDELLDADGIVIPGVSSFGETMQNLEPFISVLSDLVDDGTPLLGICLGLQILFEYSEEGQAGGLKMIKGRVERLPGEVRIPHMGWNSLKILDKTALFKDIDEGDFFFFAHSYFCKPGEDDVVVAAVDYGGDVPVVIEKGNICGVQFHPEKSAEKGLKFLSNWVEMCCK
ncbi:MAG: imidazole glycerol phosphate synthase subunit HisH [Halobacteriota archaeon]|nr:imidazole glycerol phosphate synthase subunit HisH [Halobacteriota archaeon]